MARKPLLDFPAIRRDTHMPMVLAHYGLTFPDHGAQAKINCPFPDHEDSTPSCSVNLEDGRFKCFGCGQQGNIFDFIAGMEGFEANGKGTAKAARRALDIMSLNPDDYRRGRAPKRSEYKAGWQGTQKPQNRRRTTSKPKTTSTPAEPAKTSTEANTGSQGDAEKPTENPVLDINLKLDPEHEFLASRGVGRDLAEEFGMGYCKAGIMKRRIAIPIHNRNGDLVAYTGRWTGTKDTIPEKEGKYKLPKGYFKEFDLFNLHRAAAMGKRFVVIVEGVWSTLRLHAAGIPTIALLGTSLSAVQAGLVAGAGFKYAILILDGDEGGRKAQPGVVSLLSQHVFVKTIELEDGVKPDTMDEEIVNRLRR